MALPAVSVDQRGQPVLAGLLYDYVQRFGMVRLVLVMSVLRLRLAGWLAGVCVRFVWGRKKKLNSQARKAPEEEEL